MMVKQATVDIEGEGWRVDQLYQNMVSECVGHFHLGPATFSAVTQYRYKKTQTKMKKSSIKHC